MLSPEQKTKIEAEAARRGLDPAELVRAAEQEQGSTETPPAGGPDKPKLFQYHLPFVTVREVRKNWLGLEAPFAGDSEVASEWAAKHGGGAGGTDGGTT